MDNFDNTIKNKAKLEKINVPVDFNEKIDKITFDLKYNKVRKKSKRTFLILIAATMLIVMTTVISFAAPMLVKMTEGAIAYFNAPEEFRYLSKKSEYEKFNSEVGISCEDKGIKITLDNIAVDDNYINVFYTLKSENPINLLGDENNPLKWRLQWSAINFRLKADGKYIEPAVQIEKDAYLVDDYTMQGMQRFAIMDQLNDNFNLELYTNDIWNIEGQWHMAVNVDKSSVAVESNTVMPGIKAKVSSGWGADTSKHNITVKKVSLSPFGNQIVLSERGVEVFTEFAVRDNRGNYLTVIPSSNQSHPLYKTDNSFEFISKSKNIENITIIPIMSDGHSELKNISLKDLPAELPVNDMGSYVIESIEMNEDKMQAVVSQKGAVPVIDFVLIPTDENGEMISLESYNDTEYNHENGKIIVTIFWGKDVSKEDLDKIRGFSYWENYDFKLNEDEAITIDLN
jgi:hypothetical protein